MAFRWFEKQRNKRSTTALLIERFPVGLESLDEAVMNPTGDAAIKYNTDSVGSQKPMNEPFPVGLEFSDEADMNPTDDAAIKYKTDSVGQK